MKSGCPSKRTSSSLRQERNELAESIRAFRRTTSLAPAGELDDAIGDFDVEDKPLQPKAPRSPEVLLAHGQGSFDDWVVKQRSTPPRPVATPSRTPRALRRQSLEKMHQKFAGPDVTSSVQHLQRYKGHAPHDRLQSSIIQQHIQHAGLPAMSGRGEAPGRRGHLSDFNQHRQEELQPRCPKNPMQQFQHMQSLLLQLQAEMQSWQKSGGEGDLVAQQQFGTMLPQQPHPHMQQNAFGQPRLEHQSGDRVLKDHAAPPTPLDGPKRPVEQVKARIQDFADVVVAREESCKGQDLVHCSARRPVAAQKTPSARDLPPTTLGLSRGSRDQRGGDSHRTLDLPAARTTSLAANQALDLPAARTTSAAANQALDPPAARTTSAAAKPASVEVLKRIVASPSAESTLVPAPPGDELSDVTTAAEKSAVAEFAIPDHASVRSRSGDKEEESKTHENADCFPPRPRAASSVRSRSASTSKTPDPRRRAFTIAGPPSMVSARRTSRLFPPASSSGLSSALQMALRAQQEQQCRKRPMPKSMTSAQFLPAKRMACQGVASISGCGKDLANSASST